MQVHPFIGVVQHYAWGGGEFLENLFSDVEPDDRPKAEYWMGAHPKGPAVLKDTGRRTLAEFIAGNPHKALGRAVAERYDNKLPFLLKVLDVKDMLSIQVHPSKKAAEEGFAREEAGGPDRTAPNRNYRDDNHKPELAVALSDFYLLHGFRDETSIRETLTRVPGWGGLENVLNRGGVSALYRHVMEADQATIDDLLRPLVATLRDENQYERSQPEFWTKRAVEHYGSGDRGIFSIYWFNIVHLAQGQAIFQDAGIPHAYLEGKCIELMANSDNVLRGGLTPKHIDVPELLEKTSTEAVTPNILSAEADSGEWLDYPTPAPDFSLAKAVLEPGQTLELDTAKGPCILLLMDGAAEVGDFGHTLDSNNRTAYVEPGEELILGSDSGAIIYRAGVGG